MGKARFLYKNLIADEATISVSSLRDGIVMGAMKDGEGSAVITTSGSYTGSVDREYIIEIDSVVAGNEIGQATFKWTNGGGAWNATGVATADINIELECGVQVKWTAGAGNDFEPGDRWYFKTVNLFNPGKMIDMDRDSRYRSKELESPNTITLDLSSLDDPTFRSLVLYDHNLTNGATIVLEADDAETFDSDGGSPQVSEAVAWNADRIVHYPAAAIAKDYVRLKITDTANPDGCIEIAELFLGNYFEPSKNFSLGGGAARRMLFNENSTPFGKRRRRYFNARRSFGLSYDHIPEADVDGFDALFEEIGDRDTGILRPIWFNEDSAHPSRTWMVGLTELPVARPLADKYSLTLDMVEEVKSV